MRCPYCQHEESRVIDSRELDSLVRRRRECIKCEKRFTTHETIELAPLYVIKKDNKKELFDRLKILNGLTKACEKRPVKEEEILNAVDLIESKLRNSKTTEVHSKVIGLEAMKHLKRLDKVAYLRFASVYNEFADITDFNKEISKL